MALFPTDGAHHRESPATLKIGNSSAGADIQMFKFALRSMPLSWEGKACILELKEADYHWRQMEWWGFYFEFKAKQRLMHVCDIPGDKFDNRVEFDLKTRINWDLKAKAIKADDQRVILNDQTAMLQSIDENGYHGEIIGLCDVEYNDSDRSFQKWHSELKGGLSSYEKRRKEERPNSFSRYRKTHAELMEIYYVVIGRSELDLLGVMKQGRNSNGRPRPPKYMLNIEQVSEFPHDRQIFTKI